MKKVLFLAAFCLPLSSFAAEPSHDKSERTITVQGQGKVAAIPDIATLSIEVSREGADLDPVLTQVRKQMNQVLDSVKSQGVEEKDIRTESFQVRPKYERDKRGNSQPAGYVVSNQISVKVRDLKKTGKVLTGALNAGATNVDGPNFELDHPEALQNQALAAATKAAKAQAQAVAEAAGVELGEILSINPQNTNWPTPIRPLRAFAMAAPAAAAEEPIQTGEQTLTATVSITYLIH